MAKTRSALFLITSPKSVKLARLRAYPKISILADTMLQHCTYQNLGLRQEISAKEVTRCVGGFTRYAGETPTQHR
jgi:hypothetical protein